MKLSALLLPALLLASCTSETGGSSTGGSSSSVSTSPPATGTCAADGCGSTGFCQFGYAACMDYSWQAGQYNGTCQPRPGGCTSVYEPVCGCNGQVYPNVCTANLDGQDLGARACSPSVTPSGFIPCGPLYCDPSSTYCSVTDGDVGDTFWLCTPLPSACQGVTPDCACLMATAEQTSCAVEQGQGVSGLLIHLSPL